MHKAVQRPKKLSINALFIFVCDFNTPQQAGCASDPRAPEMHVIATW